MAAAPEQFAFDPQSPVFRAHEGGKLGVHATQPLRDRADLALLYTPGVAEVSLAIAADPTLSLRYTARGNTVAVISDGTAVLGLGDIGPTSRSNSRIASTSPSSTTTSTARPSSSSLA